MKKSVIIILLYLLIGCALLSIIDIFAPKTSLGYYNDINLARKTGNECYNDGNIIHTEELEDKLIDFVIKDDILYVITYKHKQTLIYDRYRYSSLRVSQQLSDFIVQNIDNFTMNGTIKWKVVSDSKIFADDTQSTIQYSILDKSFVTDDKDVSAYEFDYNGSTYVLLIKNDT